MGGLHRGRLAALLVLAMGMAVVGCGGPMEDPPTVAAQLLDCGPKMDELGYPEGLGIGKTGELLVADTWNDRILRAGPDCAVVGGFGDSGTEPGKLECPRSLWTDRVGNIFVVDNWNHRVQKFDAQGKFLLTFGSKGGPWGYDEADGKFSHAYGVAADSRGYIYVSDFNNNRLQMFDPRGKFVMKWGTAGRQDGQFSSPAGLSVDSQDRLYVADLGNNRIQRFAIVPAVVDDKDTFEAKFAGKWGKPGQKPGEFSGPYDVCVDKEDNVYVADFWNHRVQKFTPAGEFLWEFGKHGTGEGEFECPVSVAVGEDGSVYVSDWGNNRVQKLVPTS